MLFEDYVFSKSDKPPSTKTTSRRGLVEHFSLIDYDFSKMLEFIESFKNSETFNRPVNVVSMFGESSEWDSEIKAELLRRVFGVRPLEPSVEKIFKNEFIQIVGFYDVRKSVVVLHLTSLLDTKIQMEYENDSSSSGGLLLENCEAQMGLYKALLLLFRLSHMVFVNYTSMHFQSSAQRLFRTLNNFSNRFDSLIVSHFSNDDTESSAFICGRLTIPKLLFLFDCRNQSFINEKNHLHTVLSMENLIESSLIDIISQRDPLFNLPKDERFVYLILKDDYCTPQHFLLREELSTKHHSLTEFVLAHLHTAGRVSSEDFFIILQKFLSFLSNKEKNEDIEKVYQEFNDILDVSGRFSKKVCEQTLVSGFKCYQEKLPQYYNKATHEKKKEDSIRLFEEISKGRYIKEYSKQLAEKCDNFWMNGHQLCEAISLTGNPCVNPLHALPNEDNDDDLPVLEHSNTIKYISSCNCGRRQSKRTDPFTLKAANFDFYLKMKPNCRTCRVIKSIDFIENRLYNKIMSRKDASPSKKAANVSLEDESLVELSEDEKNEEIAEESENSEEEEEEAEEDQEEEEFDEDPDSKMDENVANDDRASSSSSEYDEDDYYDDEDYICESATDEDSDLDDIEFQDGKIYNSNIIIVPMLHTGCLPSTYTLFPSWSLVRLGHSSLYSHDKGLTDQQGFIKGSNYLMPWNVRVIMQHKRGQKLWQGKPPSGLKQKKTTRAGTIYTIKIFLGTEYECLKGHRFICSGPGQILRREVEKKVKDETIQADDIATKNMPIYMNCMCHKEDSPSVAQLMRLHVVTPKVPIDVTLDPRVQTNNHRDGTVFFPGQTEPIKLDQASYWVLRLPLCYENEKGQLPIRNLSKDFCLQRGCYGISNEYEITP